MNLAIFLTSNNIEEINEWCDVASQFQTSEVNGAAIVVHHQNIAPQTVANVTDRITRMFKVKAAMPVSANSSLSNDASIAAMFARFVLGAYATYPGPWLIVEDNSVPAEPNFMQLALQQHNAHGGSMTGRARKGRGSLAPVGPVVISIPTQKIKFLRFASNESWRERGQFFFARCGFHQVPDKDYLFSIKEALPEYVAPPVAAPVVFDRASVPLPPGLGLPDKPEVAPVIDVEMISDELKVELEDQQKIKELLAEHVQVVDVGEVYKTIPGKKELLDQVEALTGKRPHHFTSEDKLRELLKTSSPKA